jgi:catechol 2,3-dioxygenase-like lactoylglutathione lyase family enzyme
MSQRIGLLTLLVGDYDEAIAYYTDLPRCECPRAVAMPLSTSGILYFSLISLTVRQLSAAWNSWPGHLPSPPIHRARLTGGRPVAA